MGIYVNPGNEGFAESVHDEFYADKTGMIRFVNAALGTKRKEICFTRPRRFGKTTAANMLAAYYSCGCESGDLFHGLKNAILRMMDGEEVPVSVSMYENNLNKIETRDDVLTTLIHLGYLSYDSCRRTARIPNIEIRNNFLMTMGKGSNEDFLARIRSCDMVREATIRMDENRVAELRPRILRYCLSPFFREYRACPDRGTKVE